jgi:hypothetical protein
MKPVYKLKVGDKVTVKMLKRYVGSLTLPMASAMIASRFKGTITRLVDNHDGQPLYRVEFPARPGCHWMFAENALDKNRIQWKGNALVKRS